MLIEASAIFLIWETLTFLFSRHKHFNLPNVILSEVEESLPYAMTMRERKTYFVYILGSLSGTLYIGITSHPEKRVRQHKQHATSGFTSKYHVDRLLYWESYDDVRKAIDREKQLKGWRREKKIQLIRSMNPHWLDLSRSWSEVFAQKGRDASTPPARTQACEQGFTQHDR